MRRTYSDSRGCTLTISDRHRDLLDAPPYPLMTRLRDNAGDLCGGIIAVVDSECCSGLPQDGQQQHVW